jgi:cell division protein FtsW
MNLQRFLKTTDSSVGPDWLLVASTMLLTGIGVVMIYSASSTLAEVKFNDAAFFLKRQLVRIVICCVIMFAAAKFNYRKLGKLSLPLLVIAFILLLILFVPGLSFKTQAIKGARRWLGLGPLTFQPSDMAKFALVLYASDYLVRKQDKLGSLRQGILPLVAIVIVFVGLVLLQPDFSTSIAICLIVSIVLFVGKTRLVHLGAIALAAVPVGAAFVFSADYRLKRILAFLSPLDDAKGMGYQTLQSLVGLGNGGILGLGLGNSRQKMFFLPEPYSDYIFSVVGEELGFLGVTVILTLFLVLIWRGLRIATKAPDMFGFLLGVGMVSIIGVYILLNLGIVVGCLPSTGLPLPFISYGGSSLMFNFMAIGVLLNISSQKKKAV